MTNNELLLLIRLICYGRVGGPGEGSRRLSGDHMVVRGNSRLKQILKEGL